MNMTDTAKLKAQIESAFVFAQRQVRALVEKHPGFYPIYTKAGKWKLLPKAHENPASAVRPYKEHARTRFLNAEELGRIGAALHALEREADFPPEGDNEWQSPLIDHYYGTHFWNGAPTRPGKNAGWTDWTHARPQS